MTSHTVQTKLNGRAISIETGKVAKQADGAVVVRCGGTIVLSTVVATKAPMEGRDFLPLTVEYRERAYAGGLRGREDPRRFLQARGPAGRKGDADLPPHRPAGPPSLSEGFPQ